MDCPRLTRPLSIKDVDGVIALDFKKQLLMLAPKSYIPSIIKNWKKLLSRTIWAGKNGLFSGRFTFSSCKT